MAWRKESKLKIKNTGSGEMAQQALTTTKPDYLN